jgi:hypothetical protein
MPITTVKTPDGKTFTAFICGRGRSTPCMQCQRPSTKLCDFPVSKGKTCDAPICDHCTTPVGPDLDYCPKHKDKQPPQRSLFEEAR